MYRSLQQIYPTETTDNTVLQDIRSTYVPSPALEREVKSIFQRAKTLFKEQGTLCLPLYRRLTM